jgi:hypothetical protein
MFSTIQEIRDANIKIGNNWFSPDTIRFFKSKIESNVLHGRYFISSEKAPGCGRKFTIRIAADDGSIGTVGEFQQFKTRIQAEKFLGNNICPER